MKAEESHDVRQGAGTSDWQLILCQRNRVYFKYDPAETGGNNDGEKIVLDVLYTPPSAVRYRTVKVHLGWCDDQNQTVLAHYVGLWPILVVKYMCIGAEVSMSLPHHLVMPIFQLVIPRANCRTTQDRSAPLRLLRLLRRSRYSFGVGSKDPFDHWPCKVCMG